MPHESAARIVRRDGDRMAPDPTVARVVLRPIGSPLPLGAMALVPSGLLLAGLQLGWFPDSETASIPYLILGFAVPLQFAASILAFLGRDAVVGTGFGIFPGLYELTAASGLK